MTIRFFFHKHDLKNAFLTGLIGGGYVAVADLYRLFRRPATVDFLSLLLVFLKIILTYAALGGLAMMTLCCLTTWRLQASESRTPRGNSPVFLGGIFTGLTVALAMTQVLGALDPFSAKSMMWVILSGVCAGWTVKIVLQRVFRPNLPKYWLTWSACLLAVFWLGTAFKYWEPIDESPYVPEPPAAVPLSHQRPNVLWIVLDSVRADHLSCYGYPWSTTPYLDRLAREGTQYLNAIASAPSCYASHASMLTGLSPSTIGAASTDWAWLDGKFQTIAELLLKNGYQTAGLSENQKNVSSETNLTRGFQYFRAFTTTQDLDNLLLPLTLQTLNGAMRGQTDRFRRLRNRFLASILIDDREFQMINTTRYAKRLLEGFKKRRSPFFLFINVMGIHAPYGASPYAGRFLKRVSMSLEEAHWRTGVSPWMMVRLWTHMSAVSTASRAAYNALYDGDLSFVDEKVGQFVETLRGAGELDNTVVILTSDHGDALGEHDLIGYGFGLEHNLLHVPLIIRYPAGFPAGHKVERWVQMTDLYPTLVNLLAIKGPARYAMAGESLLQADQQANSAVSESFLSCMPSPYPDIASFMVDNPGASESQILIGGIKSLHAGRNHFIVSRRGESLYDLEHDPGEEHNLWQSQPGLRMRLRRTLQARTINRNAYWGPRFNAADE